MTLSALRSVGDAIDATRSFMLPLSVRRWGTLAVVVFFMGTPGTPLPASPQFFDPTLWRGPEQAFEAAPAPNGGVRDAIGFEVFDPATWPQWLVATLLALAVLWIAYQVLGVLMRFVVVEALSRDAVWLREDGRAHLGDALRVFGFRVGLTLLAAPVVLVLLAAVAPIGPVTVDGWAAGVAGAIGAAIGILAWLVDAVTRQFVVPTMLRTDGGVLAAWRRFWAVLTDAWQEYVAYALVRTALGVGVGLAAAIGVGVALALGGVVVATLVAIVVVVAGGLGGIGTLGAVLVAALVIGFACYALAAYAAISAPFQVYLWTYALFVLGDTDADLDLVPEFRAAARTDDGALDVD